jgi:adenosylcobyric acid synthase
MALNSFVTADGLEVGRAQANQAAAAGVELTIDMNPILLKPQSDRHAQVVVLGKPVSVMEAADYYREKTRLLPIVLAALERLRVAFDVVVIEGAGSPAEVNLRESDIVNMRVARETNSPVVLVGDIDLGGVFAALVGTLSLLRPHERDLVTGFLINKFRGDIDLLRPGLTYLEQTTNKRVYGVVPFLREVGLAEEDSVALERLQAIDERSGTDIDIAVIQLDHVSNFDDIDALRQEPGLHIRFVRSSRELGMPAAIVIPGTKSTVADLGRLRENGMATAIIQCYLSGAVVLGICGGYQMLGATIRDPAHVESMSDVTQGLGLLSVDTEYSDKKATYRVHVRPAVPRAVTVGLSREGFEGYEVHMGRTSGPDAEPPLFVLRRTDGSELFDGAASPDGRVVGLYVHGCFDQPTGRAWFRSLLGAGAPRIDPFDMVARRELAYDRLALVLRTNVDWPALRALVGR